MRLLSPLRDFLRTEAAGGLLLLVATIAALVWANSPWSGAYHDLWNTRAVLGIGSWSLDLSLRGWVNDGLMTLFFLVVGLEIKRELTSGHLAGRRAATLPALAALGGMVVPALAYLAIAGGTNSRGWGVPIATDIALAVAVLGALGSRVPAALRALILGLAIVDDIGAILVIAVFYSEGVTLGWLVLSAAAIAAVFAAQRLGVDRSPVYWVLGTVCWYGLWRTGVHPTMAGVIMGLVAPITPRVPRDRIDIDKFSDISSISAAHATINTARSSVSVVDWVLADLHPWSSFAIVPLFALANAGIEISASGLADATRSPITWGIIVGLVVGKPLGIWIATRLGTATRLADLPEGTTRRSLIGVGSAAGIGFTVALFVAELAFAGSDAAVLAEAKLAILVASSLSAVISVAILATRRAPAPAELSRR